MSAPALDTGQTIDPMTYRQIFGCLPTGVVAITGITQDNQPTGFIVGTFQSLSLEPPLAAFCVDKSSSTWPKIRALQRFTANILSTEQLPVSRALSRKGAEKFNGLDYTISDNGTPRIAGSVAWLDCQVLSEVVAGDHYMVVGGIDAMAVGSGEAMLFRGGKFGEYVQWLTDEERKGVA